MVFLKFNESGDCMRDKEKNPLHLEGKTVILEELTPKYFPYIIEWRNNPNIGKWFNYQTVLTMESEKKWYEEVYLPDEKQVLMIRLDKKNMTPFAASGWVDMDLQKKQCIGARLMLGNPDYGRHPAFLEADFILGDYIYEIVDIMYCHVIKNNRRALRHNKTLGYILNDKNIQYPEETFVNGHELYELYRTKDMYLNVRKLIFEQLGNSLFN